jgi:hypothetical protein
MKKNLAILMMVFFVGMIVSPAIAAGIKDKPKSEVCAKDSTKNKKECTKKCTKDDKKGCCKNKTK